MAKNASPVGTSVEDDIVDRLARSAEFRDAMDRLRPFEEIAPILILRRAHFGLTQQELADRMGTTKSVISGSRAASTAAASTRCAALPRPSTVTPPSASTFNSGTSPRIGLVRL